MWVGAWLHESWKDPALFAHSSVSFLWTMHLEQLRLLLRLIGSWPNSYSTKAGRLLCVHGRQAAVYACKV